MSGTASNRAYYDAFAASYERERGGKPQSGYHDLVDELEAGYVKNFGQNGDVLEVGCGTGLVLRRIAQFARSAQGVDLSPQMLKQAVARGLTVREGDATQLPFESASFDVVCSFKVLPHVQQVELALEEMARVARPGGTILAEFYNPWSLRAAVKRLSSPGRIATNLDESHVFTRYDSPRKIRTLIPSGCELVGSRGVRIVTPVAASMKVPGLRVLLRGAETRLCDTNASLLAGFWIAAMRKTSTSVD